MTQDRAQAEDIGPEGLSSHLHQGALRPIARKRLKLSTRQIVLIAGIVATILVIGTIWYFTGITGLIILLALVLACGGAVAYRRVITARRAEREAEAARLKAERDVEAARLEAERQSRRKHIVALRNRRPDSVGILIANNSGDGSKTTTTANLALMFRCRLKAVPVIIVEGRRDSAQGAHKHGLDRSEITTIREFHTMIVEKKLHNKDGSLNNALIFAALTASEGGIFFLQADPETPKPDPFADSTGPSSLVIQTLLTTGAVVLVDTGNDSTENVTLGMANECHLGVFPTLPTAKSLTMWRDTVNNLKSHATSPIMRDCVTVLSAVKSLQEIEKAKQRLEPLPGDEGNFFVVDYDPHMDDRVMLNDENDETKVADLDKVLPENRDVFEAIVETLLEKFVVQDTSNSSRVRELNPSSPAANLG